MRPGISSRALRGILYGVLLGAWLWIAIILSAQFAYGQSVAIHPDATLGSTTSVTCTTTATLALVGNGRRRGFILAAPIGNSATIFFGFVSTVTTSSGLPLAAGIIFTDDSYIGPIYCIVATATQPMTVGEIYR